jgi:hypothetical protein
MSRHVRENHGKLALGKLLPVVEVTTSLVRAAIPSANLKSGNAGPNPRKQRLLNGPGNVQIVLHVGKLALSFRLVKRGLDVLSNFARNRPSDEAARYKNNRIKPDGRCVVE